MLLGMFEPGPAEGGTRSAASINSGMTSLTGRALRKNSPVELGTVFVGYALLRRLSSSEP